MEEDNAPTIHPSLNPSIVWYGMLWYGQRALSPVSWTSTLHILALPQTPLAG